VESHPENERFDLGIYPEHLQHWPEYRNFLFSFNLDVKDEQEHAHIPFVAILAQLAAKFMEQVRYYMMNFQLICEFSTKESYHRTKTSSQTLER
jgi:hypothetical protein